MSGKPLAKTRQAARRAPDVLDRLDAGGADPLRSCLDQIGRKKVNHTFQRLIEFEFRGPTGMRGIHAPVRLTETPHLIAQSIKIQELRFERVVEIGGVVGDLIHPINELGFKRREEFEKVFGELRKFAGPVVARVLDNALAHFKGQIKSGKIEITLLEALHNAQRVKIVIERAAMRAHQLIEFVLTGMPERRVADVVNQREGFREIRVEAQRRSDGAGDLCHLECVRQAIAKMVGKTRGEDLRLGFEAAESAGVDDAIAVARIVIAVRMRRFGITAAARSFRAHGPRRVHRQLCR